MAPAAACCAHQAANSGGSSGIGVARRPGAPGEAEVGALIMCWRPYTLVLWPAWPKAMTTDYARH